MKRKADKIKCPWCGREVGFSKSNRIMPHLGPGGVRCVAGGQPKHQVLEMIKRKESKP